MTARPPEPAFEHPLPTAYRGPRGAALVALKRAGSLTTRDLSRELRLSLNATRHHLHELEAEGVVQYRREQRGVGAPTFSYHLTQAGEALFPQWNAELLTDVLERVADQSGRSAVVSALEGRFQDLAGKLRTELVDASPARRREVVMRALVEGGFMAEWTEGAGGFRLTEHHCAIRAVAERFPEICEAEAKFLREVLSAVVEREAHILHGCPACEYSVQFGGVRGDQLTELTWNGGSREENA